MCEYGKDQLQDPQEGNLRYTSGSNQAEQSYGTTQHALGHLGGTIKSKLLREKIELETRLNEIRYVLDHLTPEAEVSILVNDKLRQLGYIR